MKSSGQRARGARRSRLAAAPDSGTRCATSCTAAPTALSGGQQQRLCLAWTIAVKPEVILLDEPVLGARSDLHGEGGGDHRGAEERQHGGHRHRQYAAGGADFRLHGVPLSGRTGGVRADRARLRQLRRTPAPIAMSPGGWARAFCALGTLPQLVTILTGHCRREPSGLRTRPSRMPATTVPALSQSARLTSRWVTMRSMRGPKREQQHALLLGAGDHFGIRRRLGRVRNTTILLCTVARSRLGVAGAGDVLADQPAHWRGPRRGGPCGGRAQWSPAAARMPAWRMAPPNSAAAVAPRPYPPAAGDDAADRAAEPLGQRDSGHAERRRQFARACPVRHRRIEQPGAVEIGGHAEFRRRRRIPLRLASAGR